MKPSQPMQVITRWLTSPRAPSTSQTASIWTCTRQSQWKAPGNLSSWEESARTPTAREETRKTERERDKDYEATGFTHSAPCFNEHSHKYMNSEAAQEYNSFSLLANLEKNKVICQALFTLVQHSSPLPIWALSLSLLRSRKPPPLPPPQPIRLQISTMCFHFYHVFYF